MTVIRTDIAVANLAELATVHVAPLRQGANAWVVLQVVVAPNRATDYVQLLGIGTPTNIISQAITLTTGTRILAVADVFGIFNSGVLQIVDTVGPVTLANGGPQFAGAEPAAPGESWPMALQGHEGGLVPGSTHTIQLQAYVDTPNGTRSVSVLAGTNPTHQHASLTLFELP
jgi:hypothetical protein